MARPLREQFEGAVYHLMVRPVGRQILFRDGRDKNYYLGLLERYQAQHGFRLYAFVMIGRRIDLLVETPRGNVGKVMQCLGTSYTSYFNRRYRRRGALFDGRYRSRVVEWRDDLVEVSRYIHRNHFQPNLSVRQRRDYRWSSYRIYLGRAGLGMIDTEPVLNCFGQYEREQRRRYRQFVENGRFLGKFPPRHPSLGRFPDLTSWAVHGPDKSRIPKNDSDEDSLRRAEKILRDVSLSFNARDGESLARRRVGALARHVAMYLIRRQTSLPLRLIGKILGVKAPAVALAIGKVERLLKEEAFYGQVKGLFESTLADSSRDLEYSSSMGA